MHFAIVLKSVSAIGKRSIHFLLCIFFVCFTPQQFVMFFCFCPYLISQICTLKDVLHVLKTVFNLNINSARTKQIGCFLFIYCCFCVCFVVVGFVVVVFPM